MVDVAVCFIDTCESNAMELPGINTETATNTHKSVNFNRICLQCI